VEATRPVLVAQGGYYVATGLLPFLSRRLFEALTGPKREWWLVQTVGAIVAVIGGALLSAARRRRASPELLGVAAGSAASLAAIDVVYVAKRRIAPTYLVDAAIELALIGALARALRR
jgi:ABC-type cobalamin transport system permease subunit